MTDQTQPDSDFPAMPRGRMVLLAIAFEGALLVLAFILGYFTGTRFWIDARGGMLDLAYGALLSLPLVAGAVAIFDSNVRLFSQVRADLKKIVHLLSECKPVDLLIIALLAGICEEALFRGFLQPYLTGIMGTAAAIAVSSLIFGALHAVSLAYFVSTALVSVYLGLVYLWFDGLAAPIALHAAYDFIALMYAIHWRPRDLAA